jgi:pimeloyl-ACP methyl ester carboxylesterase
LKPLQESTVRWALGDDPRVLEECDEWFRIVMSGMIPKVSTPVTFTPEQLQNVQVPVLLVIGEKDRLTSDPEAVKELAQNVPDIQIEVLDTGHLIGVEQPDRVNALIVEFFEQH